MLETRFHPVTPLPVFLWRMARYVAVAVLIVAVSLGAGMYGYHSFEGEDWVDAFLDASMILGAMGPVRAPQTTGGKIFAGCYALYCGLAFLFVAGLLFTPIAHRVLHLFHADPDDKDDSVDEPPRAHRERRPK